MRVAHKWLTQYTTLREWSAPTAQTYDRMYGYLSMRAVPCCRGHGLLTGCPDSLAARFDLRFKGPQGSFDGFLDRDDPRGMLPDESGPWQV